MRTYYNISTLCTAYLTCLVYNVIICAWCHALRQLLNQTSECASSNRWGMRTFLRGRHNNCGDQEQTPGLKVHYQANFDSLDSFSSNFKIPRIQLDHSKLLCLWGLYKCLLLVVAIMGVVNQHLNGRKKPFLSLCSNHVISSLVWAS